jgi:hypothetical protein
LTEVGTARRQERLYRDSDRRLTTVRSLAAGNPDPVGAALDTVICDVRGGVVISFASDRSAEVEHVYAHRDRNLLDAVLKMPPGETGGRRTGQATTSSSGT